MSVLTQTNRGENMNASPTWWVLCSTWCIVSLGPSHAPESLAFGGAAPAPESPPHSLVKARKSRIALCSAVGWTKRQKEAPSLEPRPPTWYHGDRYEATAPCARQPGHIPVAWKQCEGHLCRLRQKVLLTSLTALA